MQIISVISGDDFLSELNISIPTDDLIERLEDFVSFFFIDFSRDGSGSLDHYSRTCLGNWTNYFPVNMTKVLMRTGFCYTFNFPNLEKFYNFEADNQLLKNEPEILQFVMEDTTRREYILDYPAKVPNYKVGLHMECYYKQQRRLARGHAEYIHEPFYRPTETRQGFRLMFHDPFELPSMSSYQYYFTPSFTRNYLIVPEVMRLDDSMLKYSLTELVIRFK